MPLLTVQDAANYLQIKPISVLRLIRDGKVQAAKVGPGTGNRTGWRIRQSDLDSYVADMVKSQNMVNAAR